MSARSRTEVADLRVVVAVADPAVRRGRERGVDTRLEHVGRRLLPARVVVERVELDVWDAEPARELAGERRLAGARPADDGDASQRRNSPRATMTAEPPTSTSSGERATAYSVDGRPISTPWWISISSPKSIRPCRARWSASGPAAEPVAGSSATPCAGTKTRAFQLSPSRAKQTVPYGLSSSSAPSRAAARRRPPASRARRRRGPGPAGRARPAARSAPRRAGRAARRPARTPRRRPAAAASSRRRSATRRARAGPARPVRRSRATARRAAAARASTNAVPSIGCPANGSSSAGVKIRIRACPSPAAGRRRRSRRS